MAKAKPTQNISSVVAKEDDGTVQITFTLPQTLIAQHEEHSLQEMAKTVKVPGFRPGKAPLDQVKSRVSSEKLVERTLSQILPKAFSDAIDEHSLKPATYPKFEILSQGEEWQIRAVTCEIVEFDLGDYKNTAAGTIRAASLTKELSKEEKEQKVIQALVESIKVTIPHILIEEEVNARLAQLLERIEKLGLTLDGYLASIGKSVETLRGEYEQQTKQAISLELILNKIAALDKIEVDHEEVHKAIAAMSADPKQDPHANPDQHRAIESILRRRAVLDSLLTSL